MVRRSVGPQRLVMRNPKQYAAVKSEAMTMGAPMSAHSATPMPPGGIPVTDEDGSLAPGWRRIRVAAGYGAASSMGLYLLVKCLWVISALLGGTGPGEWRTTDWIVLNAVTAAMAATGVALGLGLAQGWGRRIPAPLVLAPAWVGAGFLVPLLPYMLLSTLVATGGSGTASGGAGEGAMPAWEVAFITVGFIGMAAGLAVALPLYLRERWPAAMTGRVGDATQHLGCEATRVRAARTLVAFGATTALSVLWLTWAVGGTLGLDPAQHQEMTGQARLLMTSAGLWALAGAWATWTLTGAGRAPTLRLWVPMSTAFAASGSLFAWSCWKLPLALLRPSGYATVEYPAVAFVEHSASIIAGLVVLACWCTCTAAGPLGRRRRHRPER